MKKQYALGHLLPSEVAEASRHHFNSTIGTVTRIA